MKCPQCDEAVEPGAAFCGNCGRALTADTNSSDVAGSAPQPAPIDHAPSDETVVAAAPTPLPAYAVVDPAESKREPKAMVGLIISIIAIPAAVIPFLGVALAVMGIVVSARARSMTKRVMHHMSVGFAILALVLSVVAYMYNLQQYNSQAKSKDTVSAQQPADKGQAVAAQATIDKVIDTPCYSVVVPDLQNVDQVKDSCNTRLFNAETLAASDQVFTVDTVRQPSITAANFADVSKQLVENYVKNSLPDYTITAQRASTFAGSPSYVVSASNRSKVSVQMAVVLRAVEHGENIFVLVHGLSEGQADISMVEKTWQWK